MLYQLEHFCSRILATILSIFLLVHLEAAQAAGPAVAKIGSVDRTIDAKTFEITLDGVRGDIQNGSTIEIETTGGKAKGTISLPDGFPTFTQSMSMKRVKISLEHPATLAAGQRVGSGGGLSTPDPVAAAKPRLKACPFTPAELSAAMGWPAMKIERENVTNLSGAEQHDCYYKAKNDVVPSLTVIQLYYDDPRGAPETQRRMNAKGRPLPGDPDQAQWLAMVAENQELGISYVRKNTYVTLRADVGYNSAPAKMEANKQKIARLKRFP